MPRLLLAALLLAPVAHAPGSPFLSAGTPTPYGVRLAVDKDKGKDKKEPPSPLAEARKFFDAGEFDKALSAVNRAVELEPKSTQAHLLRGDVHDALGKHAEAVSDYAKVLELDPKFSTAYHLRGCSFFKAGKFSESVADFDKYLELNPNRKPGHWQRGISCYYAGKFEEGKVQFEGYQTTDANDVENAVWRFMCQAKKDNIAKCRQDMLKIGADRRVPMKEVYDLFMGKIEPKDVIAAAMNRKADKDQKTTPLFYAHLYLGLYFETMGDRKQALEHMNKAADDYRQPRHYMWDVARVHRDVLRRDLDKK